MKPRRLPILDWMSRETVRALLVWSENRVRHRDLAVETGSDYGRMLVNDGRAHADDVAPMDPSPGVERISQYRPPIGEVVMHEVRERLIEEAEQYMVAANSFYRIYGSSDQLVRHTDRDELDYTVTIMLGLYGMPSWSIWADVDGVDMEIPMAPGDAVLITGRIYPHWREPLPQHAQAATLYLHYSVGTDPSNG